MESVIAETNNLKTSQQFINKEQEAICFASNILVPQYFLEKEAII